MRLLKPLILASKSQSRTHILQSAGLSFQALPADLDETMLKNKGLKEGLSPKDIGKTLAREKALKISKENLDALVVGADQILEFEGEVFEKPKNMKEARAHLMRFCGKTHKLISCVALVEAGKVAHEFQDEARLTMKPFSEEFLDSYLKEAGKQILKSVGAYQLEGLGAVLFEEVEGDFFTILGLPLEPLLDALEKGGALER